MKLMSLEDPVEKESSSVSGCASTPSVYNPQVGKSVFSQWPEAIKPTVSVSVAERRQAFRC